MVRGQQTNKKNRRIFPFLLTSQHILDNMVESYLIVTMRHDISAQNKKNASMARYREHLLLWRYNTYNVYTYRPIYAVLYNNHLLSSAYCASCCWWCPIDALLQQLSPRYLHEKWTLNTMGGKKGKAVLLRTTR
jgi:hypothetical protein